MFGVTVANSVELYFNRNNLLMLSCYRPNSKKYFNQISKFPD
jgi:hypothetical protein